MAIMNPYNYKKPAGIAVNVNGSKPAEVTAASNVTKSKSDMYLEQRIMNARPEELTLMLFDGLVKFIKQVEIYNDQNNIDKSNTANLRAQAILQELRSTLNMEIVISENLEHLYVYMMERLIDANISKDNKIIEEVSSLAADLRDAWKAAMNL